MRRPTDSHPDDPSKPHNDPLFELLGRDLARLERVRRHRRRPRNRTSPWRRRVGAGA